MSRKVYIGRPSKHVGKTAFQILANLKNFGVGRMLTRHEFDVFDEPSFHLIKRVETYMDSELKFGTLWCETVIRGQRLPGIRPLKVTYKPDFRLISKDEQERLMQDDRIKDLHERQNVLPKHYQVPPLMREWMLRHQARYARPKSTGSNEEFEINFIYQDRNDLRKPDSDLFWIGNRLQENEKEKPTVKFDGKFHFNEHYLKHCYK